MKKAHKSINDDIENMKMSIRKIEKKSTLKVQFLVSSAEKEKITNGLKGFADIVHLHSGDFWIILNDKLLFLFERKTLQDLSSSFQDQRWRSQKFKMEMMPIHPSRTFYLIEDSESISHDMSPWLAQRASIAGAQVNIIARERRQIFRTQDEFETIYFMLTLMKKTYEFGEEYLKELEHYQPIDNKFDPLKVPLPVASTEGIEEKKKRSIDGHDEKRSGVLSEIEQKFVQTRKKKKCVENPDTWYMTCLSSIPRMGAKANAIMNVYPKLTDLVKFITGKNKTKAEIIKLIENIQCTTSNVAKCQKKTPTGKERRLPRVGKVIAGRIYEYIMGLDDDDDDDDDDVDDDDDDSD
jgi:ERCC4-type nuclease